MFTIFFYNILNVLQFSIRYTNFKHQIITYVFISWQNDWNGAIANKHHSFDPFIHHLKYLHCQCIFTVRHIFVGCNHLLGGNGMFVPPPPPPPPPHTHTLLTPHFHFPLELYVSITMTNNYLAFFIYQFIILWTISIN